MKQKTEV